GSAREAGAAGRAVVDADHWAAITGHRGGREANGREAAEVGAVAEEMYREARDQGVLGTVERAGRVEARSGERARKTGREGPPAAGCLERERGQFEGNDRDGLAVPPDPVSPELLLHGHLAD